MDTTTVKVTYTYEEGWEECIVVSPYFPYDSDEPPPTKEVRYVTDYCHRWKK
jgi:hypothetical protein